MNPVTLKELRQLTRSRTISGAIIGFFILQLVVTALVILSCSNDNGTLDRDTGELVFAWLGVLLAPLIAFVVPGNLFARLVSEHGPGRAELLMATGLRPSAFIDGKIRSGLALIAVFIAGALPFLLLSYLLRGVDTLMILSWTAAVALLATVAVHLSLFLASARIPAVARWCIWTACAIPCVPFALLSSAWAKEEILDYLDDWEVVPLCLLFVVAANLLLRGLAIAQLSPRETDRARPLRLTAAALWVVLLVVFAILGKYAHTPSNAILAITDILAIAFTFLAAFDLSSASGPSRRVLLDRPRPRWRRLLRWPFTTGAESGLVFALAFLGVGALLGLFVLHRGHPDPWSRNDWLAIHIGCAYVLAALLFARAIARIPALARRGGERGTALIAIVLLVLTSVLPGIVTLHTHLDPALSPFNLAGIEVPYWKNGGNLAIHFRYAISGLFIGLLLHLRPVLRSLLRYLRDTPNPTPKNLPPPISNI